MTRGRAHREAVFFFFLRQKLHRNTHAESKGMGVLSDEEV